LLAAATLFSKKEFYVSFDVLILVGVQIQNKYPQKNVQIVVV
jgi:hypothetical protein